MVRDLLNRVPPEPEDACLPGEIKCSTKDYGRICLPAEARCNGIEECADGYDEQNCYQFPPSSCTPQEFSCDVSRCIPLASQCDGRRDCADGLDERDCPEGGGPPHRSGPWIRACKQLMIQLLQLHHLFQLHSITCNM
ncbi:very low-density lipoprotein receptor-like [Nilaparvata lugens]|uniref:very low-density lipoprotein receptor-like n=1 Tax=Nilaparvata lugens TaxID=108931 RepID=UPI00193D4D7F|nr:very low-density lipoprotein receptor-like [Nilaparvata lugens]